MTRKAVANELASKQDAAQGKIAFYECHECQRPFFGGLADCERDLNMAETTKKEDMVCKRCIVKRVGGGQYNCKKHGHKYIAWKCSLCCSEALFRCGPTYFCDDCHHGNDDELTDCEGGPDCPLGVPHPPASRNPIKAMYPLGCNLCRRLEGVEEEAKIEEIELDDEVRYQIDQRYQHFNPLNDYAPRDKSMLHINPRQEDPAIVAAR